MMTPRAPRFLRIPLLSFVLLAAIGCGPDGPIDEGPEADERRMVLGELAENVILPTYRDFETEAVALEAAVAAYALSLDVMDRDAARLAYRDAMNVWQRAEVMQVGPALPVGNAGGEGYRDEIYSWDLTSYCRIDQETVSGDYADVDVFAMEVVNARGLDALEYLLFNESDVSLCGPAIDIISSGAWDMLVMSGTVEQSRADYSHTLATLVRREAEALRDAWEPSGGDYGAEFSTAGMGGVVYRTSVDALNAVSDAFFYVDTRTKDEKVATPAGIQCDLEPCVVDPGLVEMPYSNHSLAAVRANLEGFQELFLGGVGSGVADLVETADVAGTDLAARVETASAGALVAVDAVTPPLADAVVNDAPAVQTAYDAIKAVTDLMKLELVQILELQLPQGAQGDSD